jgi:uncharacterized protein
MSWTLVAVLVVASSQALALTLPLPITGPRLWLGLALPYVGLGLLAVLRSRRDTSFAEVVRFRPGDPSLGIALAVVLLLGGWALSSWLLPVDSPGHAWLLRIVLAAGDVSSASLTACLMVIAALEELVWRGWVQGELVTQWGARRGWMLCAAAYGIANGTTLATLADPVAGYNPLIFLGALGCGACWSFLRGRTGRIMPGLFSHLALSYLAAQYLGRLI